MSNLTTTRIGSIRQAYENALLENSSTLNSVESSLRNISWFLPGRFKDAELASEGLYSLLSLISLYHDSLLARKVTTNIKSVPPPTFESTSSPTPVGKTSSPSPSSSSSTTTPLPLNLPPPSDHARYVRYWSKVSPTYAKASRTLVVIGYVQLLIEMLVRKRKGDKARWKVLLGIESVKTALRLILLYITKQPVLAFPVEQREYDPESLVPTSTRSGHSAIPLPKIPSLPSGQPSTSHVLPQLSLLSDPYLPSPALLIPQLSSKSQIVGEILHATSGLLHISLMLYFARRARLKHRSPHPGISFSNSYSTLSSILPASLIPLGILLLSRKLRRADSRELSPLLAQLYQSRDKDLFWWFLKGPIYHQWTKAKIEGIVEWCERDGYRKYLGLGLVGGLVEDHLRLLSELYYCE